MVLDLDVVLSMQPDILLTPIVKAYISSKLLKDRLLLTPKQNIKPILSWIYNHNQAPYKIRLVLGISLKNIFQNLV